MGQTQNGVRKSRSLEEVHRTVRIPPSKWWRRLFAFAGPAYLVSVGYMDPGNWATDIQGGSQFGYSLIWVLLMSNAMAVLLQTLSARLGLIAGRDLAQACRDDYPFFVNIILYILCEIAIAACDLAEVIGSAIGLNLLSAALGRAVGINLEIPVLWAVLITGFDVLLLLFIQKAGIRKLEAFILALVFTIGVCFLIEIFLCKPSISGIASGFIPHPLSGLELYVAIGIVGATVMPHNLYLHSALVQSRDVTCSREAVAQACKYNLIDSAIAMNGAFFVNAAILIVAAATFWNKVEVTEIQQASALLQETLGSQIAPIAFALALLCAGQSSTVTGTLAGQITMEGFLRFRIKPWLRRLITRTLAIVPAVIVISMAGEKGIYQLLILSQVILSLQLSFAVVPLVRFTSSKRKMGPFVNPWWVKVLAWLVTAVIAVLNGKLVYETISSWIEASGQWQWLVIILVLPVSIGLSLLLVWMVFRRERPVMEEPEVSADAVVSEAAKLHKHFKRIGVALEAKPSDAPMLAEAVSLARSHRAELLLMHIVDGVGGTWYGTQTGDSESREDEIYLQALVKRLKQEPNNQDLPGIDAVLGYGDPSTELVNIAREKGVDLVVMGGHGHRGLLDIIYGQTISGVRHDLNIPIVTVRGSRE